MSVGDSYFYLDYRDTRYRSYNYAIGHPQDIWIEYDPHIDQVRISQDYDFAPEYTVTVTNGSYHSIWEMKGQSVYDGSPRVSNVEYYWQNCLVILDDYPEFRQEHPVVMCSAKAG